MEVSFAAPGWLNTSMIVTIDIVAREFNGISAGWTTQAVMYGDPGASEFKWVGGSAPTANDIAVDGSFGGDTPTIAISGTTLEIGVEDSVNNCIWEATVCFDVASGVGTPPNPITELQIRSGDNVLTLEFTDDVTAGDTVYIICAVWASVPISGTPTSDFGTFTLLANWTQPGLYGMYPSYVYWCQSASGGGKTITFVGDQDMVATAIEVAGSVSANTVAMGGVAGSDHSETITGTIANASAGDFCFICFGSPYTGAGTVTDPGSPWTTHDELSPDSEQLFLAYYTPTSMSALSATWTYTSDIEGAWVSVDGAVI